jgi:hypothetical protein
MKTTVSGKSPQATSIKLSDEYRRLLAIAAATRAMKIQDLAGEALTVHLGRWKGMAATFEQLSKDDRRVIELLPDFLLSNDDEVGQVRNAILAWDQKNAGRVALQPNIHDDNDERDNQPPAAILRHGGKR